MIAGDAFQRLRLEAGFNSIPALAAFLGVTKRTIGNWEQSGVPAMAEKLLRLLARDLSFLGADWAGWRIVSGQFVEYGGTGYTVSPGEMRAFTHMERCMELQRLEIERLQQELAAARAQCRFQDFVAVSVRADFQA
jgi:transcriptional regulator with XRE-family HTH domain